MVAAVAKGSDDSGRTTDVAPFDPAAAVFVAQRQRPRRLGPVDLVALSPFQRGLLVIDGTVTSFIEAYVLEPIDVVRLGQDELTLAGREPWLELAAGTSALRRQVLLRGRRTGRFFAWADSLIASARLVPAIRRALQTEGGGLGRILVDARIETRRECLWYGRETGGETPAEVAALWHGAFLSRTYRVLSGSEPIMLITERFPL